MKNLYKSLTLPIVFAKTDQNIWTDTHISKQLLKAHLDPSFEGATRPLSFVDQSVSWITKTIIPTQYPKLLDIGCGPGIYAERFTKNGYDVVGVDFSSTSINYVKASARKQNLNIKYRKLNYLNLNDCELYDFATMIYCDYGALSKTDRSKLLQNVYCALKPKGRFLLDVFSTRKINQFEECNIWNHYPEGGFWSNQSHFTIQQNKKYENQITLEHTIIFEEEKIRNVYLWTQFFSRESLVREACDAGFKVLHVYGDVAGKPYHKDSMTLAILLEK